MEKVCLYFLFLIKFATAGPTYDVVNYQVVGNGITDDTDVLFISLSWFQYLSLTDFIFCIVL